MTGVSESNMLVGVSFMLAVIFGLGAYVYYLLKIGWKIRD
jgi:hypothetical protein